jgi:hypothetical protein
MHTRYRKAVGEEKYVETYFCVEGCLNDNLKSEI